MGPCGARAIACGIAHCTELKNLHMSNTNTDIDTATHILLSLKNSHLCDCNFSLVKKKMNFCTIGVHGLIFPEDDERALVSLKAAAQHPTHVQTIDVNPEHKK